jgi:hypothetical protein
MLAKKGNGSISEANLGQAIKDVLKDQNTLKDLIKEAKSDYKK